MKILTNEQYKSLVERAGDEDTLEVTKLKAELLLQKESYENKIKKINKENEDREIDNQILVNRQVLLNENELIERTKKITEEKDSLKMKLNNAEKENEIMTKAFENMGFDVKDMKNILDQLVKGIISKNTINVIK
jgi:hypothetical protein